MNKQNGVTEGKKREGGGEKRRREGEPRIGKAEGQAASPSSREPSCPFPVPRSWPGTYACPWGIENEVSAGVEKSQKRAGEAAASPTTQRVLNYYIKHLLCLSRIGSCFTPEISDFISFQGEGQASVLIDLRIKYISNKTTSP